MTVGPQHESESPTRSARNLQARGTIGILNAVRWGGTGVLALLAVISIIAMLVTFVGSTSIGYGFGSLLLALIFTIWAALFYALVGWFVDSLSLLSRIEENTRRAE